MTISKDIIIYKLEELQEELNQYLRYAADHNIEVRIAEIYTVPSYKITGLTKLELDICDREKEFGNAIRQGY